MKRTSLALVVLGTVGAFSVAFAQTSDSTTAPPKASLENATTKTPVTPRTSFQTTETHGTSQKGKSTVPQTSFDSTETKRGGTTTDTKKTDTATKKADTDTSKAAPAPAPVTPNSSPPSGNK
jgi:hypothetical protein